MRAFPLTTTPSFCSLFAEYRIWTESSKLLLQIVTFHRQNESIAESDKTVHEAQTCTLQSASTYPTGLFSPTLLSINWSWHYWFHLKERCAVCLVLYMRYPRTAAKQVNSLIADLVLSISQYALMSSPLQNYDDFQNVGSTQRLPSS
jgi:hypothetical protein